jgi:hypothetical protein
MRSWQAQKSPAQSQAFGFLVAGARLPNYMHIKLAPFALVA